MSFVALILFVLVGLVLGILGGGGSIVTLPILVEVLGMPLKDAIVVSLAVVAATSSVAVVFQFRSQQVELRLGLFFAAFAMSGAYLGGRAADFVATGLLQIGFLATMFASAWFMLRPAAGQTAARPLSERTRLQRTGLALRAFAVGGATGLVGAGGGFLVVPALMIFGGLPLRRAIGTSLMITAFNAYAGLAGHLNHVQLDGSVLVPILWVSGVGAVVGHRLAQGLSTRLLQVVFAYFVVGVAVYSGVSAMQDYQLFARLDEVPGLGVITAAVAVVWAVTSRGRAV